MNQHENYIRSAAVTKSHVIDQDPIAIVRVYCKLFREQERIKQVEYAKFLLRLFIVERSTQRALSLHQDLRAMCNNQNARTPFQCFAGSANIERRQPRLAQSRSN